MRLIEVKLKALDFFMPSKHHFLSHVDFYQFVFLIGNGFLPVTVIFFIMSCHQFISVLKALSSCCS